MKFPGVKTNGQLVHAPAIAEAKRKYWERAPEGAMIESSLTVKHKDKTSNQLGAIWGLMLTQAVSKLDDRGYDTSFIYNLSKPTGIAITKDDLCHFFYNACPIYNDNQRITLSKSDTKQAAKFFDDVRDFMASQWGIYIPEPDPNWREKGSECG